MTLLRITAVGIALVLSPGAIAFQPAPPPPDDGARSPRDIRPAPPREGRGGPGDRRRNGPSAVAEDSDRWTTARAFLAETSPHRLEMYEAFATKLRERHGDRSDESTDRMLGRVRGRIVARVEELSRLAEEKPEHHAHALQQFRIEDAIMGHLIDARDAKAAGDEDAAEASVAKAKEQAQAFHGLAMERRARELDEAAGRIERERQRLEADRDRADEVSDDVVRRFERMVERGLEGHRPPRGRPSTRPGRRD